jgi:hypothetical protein
MIFGSTNGQRVEFTVQDIGSTLEVVAAYPGSPIHIESVNFCNKTGAAVDITLCKTSGDDNHYYLHTFDVPANEPYLFKDHAIVLTQGQSLRALASTGSAIDVSVVGIQSIR